MIKFIIEQNSETFRVVIGTSSGIRVGGKIRTTLHSVMSGNLGHGFEKWGVVGEGVFLISQGMCLKKIMRFGSRLNIEGN